MEPPTMSLYNESTIPQNNDYNERYVRLRGKKLEKASCPAPLPLISCHLSFSMKNIRMKSFSMFLKPATFFGCKLG